MYLVWLNKNNLIFQCNTMLTGPPFGLNVNFEEAQRISSEPLIINWHRMLLASSMLTL